MDEKNYRKWRSEFGQQLMKENPTKPKEVRNALLQVDDIQKQFEGLKSFLEEARELNESMLASYEKQFTAERKKKVEKTKLISFEEISLINEDKH
ncbi:hypothetical protein [Enterococcus sp. LJL51]|uniref:hypothetical protein n=1 Tax=Enterococcus sp. LJL51 TaxID=3416656 RepID=UPI003CF0E6DF